MTIEEGIESDNVVIISGRQWWIFHIGASLASAFEVSCAHIDYRKEQFSRKGRLTRCVGCIPRPQYRAPKLAGTRATSTTGVTRLNTFSLHTLFSLITACLSLQCISFRRSFSLRKLAHSHSFLLLPAILELIRASVAVLPSTRPIHLLTS